MDAYQVGRDIQELRSRVERLEAGQPITRDQRDAVGVASTIQASVNRDKRPMLWKHEKAATVPAFVHGLLGLAPDVRIEAAESKTWPGSPDPTIFWVTWSNGSTDEYFRLINPLFSVIRYDSGGGQKATATYQAQLVAAGKAYSGNGSIADLFDIERIFVRMTDSMGLIIWNFDDFFTINCNDNKYLIIRRDFPPEFYDNVTGANWSFAGGRVGRC